MTTDNTSPSKENSALGLSGMIIAIVGVICAFLTGWHRFGMILSIAGAAVCFVSLKRADATHSKRIRAIVGICFGLVGIVVGGYYWNHRESPAGTEVVTPDTIPTELQDTAADHYEHNSALEKLEIITDSSDSH